MTTTPSAHPLELATPESIAHKVHHLAEYERMRLWMLNGSQPTNAELHAAVEESCVTWCESWFSPAEKALPQEAKDQLARTWLRETGVLASLNLI